MAVQRNTLQLCNVWAREETLRPGGEMSDKRGRDMGLHLVLYKVQSTPVLCSS